MNIISLIDGDDLSPNKISKLKNSKIFSFDIFSQKLIEKLNLNQTLADTLLTSKEREDIFDHVVSKIYWYENIEIPENLFIEGKNSLEMLDPLYLHQKLLVILLRFAIIKKIIENENPEKIYVTSGLSKIVSIFTDSEIILLNSESESTFDTFDLRFTIFSKLFSIKISMKNFQRLKDFFEMFAGKLFNLWLNPDAKKPIILLLEFDPTQYPKLLQFLKSSKHNVVLLNRRKSTMYNFNSIQEMKNSNSKIINFKKLLSSNEKSKIHSIQKQLCENLKNFWEKNDFTNFFSYCGHSYWICIKNFLIEQYEIDTHEFVKIFFESKLLFEKFNVKCILYQYESAIAENTLLSLRNQTPSLLLRHGFSSYTKKTNDLRWRYDTFRFIHLNCDEILVWGNLDYDYYSSYLHNSKKLKIVGSPRHEMFFEKIIQNNNKSKTILITTPPITEWSGLLDINVALRYEKILTNLINDIKKIPNVKIIGKLHPGWGWKFNDILIKIFKEIDPSIPVFSIKSIKQLISDSHLVVNITPEDNEPSTVMLEGLIMKKPVIEVSLDERNQNMEYDELHPIISLSYKSNVEHYILKVLNDPIFRKKISLKTNEFLTHYISNQKSVSEFLANYLKSF